MSSIRLLDCSKLTKNWENDNDIIICWHHIIVKFFGYLFVPLSKFSCWSKLLMSISSLVLGLWKNFYKGLTRNLETENTPAWVLPNIWRLGRVRDTIFGTYVSNKMLLNAAKCQGYSFSRLWFIKGKPTGVKLPLLLCPGIRKSTQKWKILIRNYFLQCFIDICIKFKTRFLNLITTWWKWFLIKVV